MRRINAWAAAGMTRLNQIPIVRKMILGYFLLVLLPLILFGSLLYNHLFSNMIDSYSNGKQSLVNQSGDSFQLDLARVNSIYSLFQYDPIVVDFLNGQYQTNSDQVYNFVKYIQPMFQFAYLGNHSIDSINLYKLKNNVLSSGEIQDMNSLLLPASDLKKINALKNKQGLWVIQPNADKNTLPPLSYYQKIYDNSYTNELAIMNVNFNKNIFNNLFKGVNVNEGVGVVMVSNKRILYKDMGPSFNKNEISNVLNTIKESHKSYWIYKKDHLLINSLKLKDLNLDIYFVSPVTKMFASIYKKTIIFGLLLFGLLCLLSAIYYATGSMLTQRVLRLAKHMRNVDENRLTPYMGDQGKDEIGLLTLSYNSLINRINDLMNKVHRAEFLKKEADYLVLQAQVNPHFLYNTLESIRMLAEMNEDEEVVEATYTLSKLLRYSLSSEGNTTTLEEEVSNITDYLSIQKLRMGDKLSYCIHNDLSVVNFVCPRFILQPLVENCINHGLSNVRKSGKIVIEIKESNLYTFVTVTDNGAGITEERLAVINGVLNNTLDKTNLKTQSSGLGLYNVSERVKVFFGERSGLEVKSRLGYGTSLILKFQK